MMIYHVLLNPILIEMSLKIENLTLKQNLSIHIAHMQQKTVMILRANLIITSISFENDCPAALRIKNNLKPHLHKEAHPENYLLHTKDFHVHFNIINFCSVIQKVPE